MPKAETQDWRERCERMLKEQCAARGIDDPAVLAAMGRVPRHRFVDAASEDLAYCDGALPIACGQTISQPFMVAAMTQALGLRGGERVLEIGTGSGYQYAILAELGAELFSIEYVPALARGARARLSELGYREPRIVCADGSQGLPRGAPFDAILAAAVAPAVPPALIEQLAEGGRMVIPIGSDEQWLMLIEKRAGKALQSPLMQVRFVPMLGATREA